MIDLLVLVLLISVVCIWYFIKKRPNKAYKNIAIAVAVISFVIIGVTAPNEKPKTATKEAVSSKKTSKKTASPSTIKAESSDSASKAAKAKAKLEAESTSRKNAESSSVAASVAESEKALSESNAKQAKAEQDKREKMKSFARTFGNKPAQEIQRKSYTYSSNNVDGMGMVYMWKNDFGTLMRVDSSDNITSVYLYDANADQRKGELLYQGHTIINEQKKQYNFYN